MSATRRVPSVVFILGPWRWEDGDASCPETVLGVPVIERLSEDPNGARALVRLADRRYALTGRTVVVAPRRKLDRYLRRRGHELVGDAWLEELRAALRGRVGSRRQQSGGPS